MASEQELKQIKAKLYNLKNGVEGLMPLIDAGVLLPNQVSTAVATLSAKSIDELNDLKQTD